jgi:hypothetical protein
MSHPEIREDDCDLESECCPEHYQFRLLFQTHDVNVAFGLPAQPIDPTHALKHSAGVSNPSVLRGRSFNWRAPAFNFA